MAMISYRTPIAALVAAFLTTVSLPAIAQTELGSAQEAVEVASPGEALLEQARILRVGVTKDPASPLLVPDLRGARAALEQAVALPGSHQTSAKVSLAKMLLNGEGGQVDEISAIAMLTEARDAGNAEAAFLLGVHWLEIAGKEDDGQASLTLALQLGYGAAGFTLADHLAATDPDRAQALRDFSITLLTSSAQSGGASEAFALAEYYRKSPIGPDSQAEALKWYDVAAGLGNARAIFWKARIEADTESPSYDPEKAVADFDMSANLGSIEAARQLIAPGSGLPVSQTTYDRWMSALLIINDANAQLINLNTIQASIEARNQVASDLYNDLMNEEVPSIDELLELGARFRDGDGVVADLQRALDLFERGALRGSKDAILRHAELLTMVPALQTAENTALSFAKLKAIADEGSIGGAVMLGNFYRYGIGTPVDMSLAIQAYSVAAEDGNSIEAMNGLASLYAADPDLAVRQQALGWLQRAAEAGSVAAQIKLAEAYAAGDIVARDQLQSIQWYQRAIDAGDTSALTSLVATFELIDTPAALQSAQEALELAVRRNIPDAPVIYANFLVRRGNPVAAVALLEQPELAERPDVALALNLLYADPTLSTYDLEAANRWLGVAYANITEAPKQRVAVAVAMLSSQDPQLQSQAVAILVEMSDAKIAEAARYLGRAYVAGIGVPQHIDQGVESFRTAALLGDPDATIELADYYLEGLYVEQDIQQAVGLYEAVLEAQPDFPAANLRLGNIFAEGLLGTKDMELAARYYRRAAESGNASAQRALGRAYIWGAGVPQDAGEAERWLNAAAEAGSANAAADLVMLYGSAMAPGFDPARAFEQTVVAAKSGDLDAMGDVGIALISGFGVPTNVEAGISWLERAASAGSSPAMYDLYRLYNFGEGVDQDRDASASWLARAVEAENASAMYVAALPLLESLETVDQEAGIALLRKAAGLKHNQATKRLVAMKLLEAPEEDYN